MCWNEALKVMHLQLAEASKQKHSGEQQHHIFQARLADVRTEIAADVCTMHEMRDAPRAELHGVTTSKSLEDTSFRESGWCGVNLGGWLLWEPGPANDSPLVASLGEDADVPSCEWTLCKELVSKHGREEATALVQKHRMTHVTREDFVEMKRLGANSVRVPFGYWVLVGPRSGEPFIGPCTEFLDAALEWGSELGLSVVLCYHSAIGFQSYDPPCGRKNEEWDPADFDIAANVEVLKLLARAYGSHPALGGICVLNEPHGDLPAETLNTFFKDAYSAMRNVEKLPHVVQIMLPVFHHEFTDFNGRYTPDKGFVNVVFDVHCYQVFGDPYAGWCRMSLAKHLRYATAATKSHPVQGIVKRGERVVVTEFSLALPMWNENMMINKEFAALTPTEKKLLHKSFALRQLHAFAQHTEGWFFWCWKDDSGPDWSFAESMLKGWMPPLSSNDAESTAVPLEQESSSSMDSASDWSGTPCMEPAAAPLSPMPELSIPDLMLELPDEVPLTKRRKLDSTVSSSSDYNCD
jgi:glucan 1,3-beta-glucosidase